MKKHLENKMSLNPHLILCFTLKIPGEAMRMQLFTIVLLIKTLTLPAPGFF